MRTPQTLFRAALAHHRAGRHGAAARAYRAVLTLSPADAKALHNLGLLIVREGSVTAGLACLRRALCLHPGAELFRRSWCEGLLASGQPDAALAAVATARARGLDGPAWQDLEQRARDAAGRYQGQAIPADRLATLRRLLEEGRCRAVVAAAQEVTARWPADPRGWTLLGAGLRTQGKAEAAATAFRAAVALEPAAAVGYANLGAVLRDVPQLHQALSSLDRALRIAPHEVQAWLNKGICLTALDDATAAVAALRVVLIQCPAWADAWMHYGVALGMLGRPRAAENAFRRALHAAPEADAPRRNLTVLLRAEGRSVEAAAVDRHTLCRRPSAAAAWVSLGITAADAGRLDAAEVAWRRAVRLDPEDAEAWYRLSTLSGGLADDWAAGAILDRLTEEAGRTSHDRMLAHFALARRLDSLDQPEEAIGHLKSAHRIRATMRGHPYDRAAAEARLDHLRRTVTRAFVAALAPSGDPSQTPILIVGMPRSGTTLVEQILASHSWVFGAGELPALGRLARHPVIAGVLDAAAQGAGPEGRSRINWAARSYLDTLKTVSGGSARVTDKMPHNYEHLWLAALLIPNATIINCVRDPVDTCLSCFFQPFGFGHAYADDLADLGHQYRLYQDYMRLWTRVLPIPIHTVVYEDLVREPEVQIPALLDACGLPFEPGCLSFHTTDRPIRTASMSQVRRRVYTSSVAKWHRYEAHLGPLLRALEAPAHGPGI